MVVAQNRVVTREGGGGIRLPIFEGNNNNTFPEGKYMDERDIRESRTPDLSNYRSG